MKGEGRCGAEERAENDTGNDTEKGISNGLLAILLLAFFTLAGLATIGALVRVTQVESEVEARALIRAAGPLCAAIDAYSLRTGRSPEALDVLVPGYVSELPPLHGDAEIGFRYQGGEGAAWCLSIWGGHFMYERSSVEEPWYITGDLDQSYPQGSWLPFE